MVKPQRTPKKSTKQPERFKDSGRLVESRKKPAVKFDGDGRLKAKKLPARSIEESVFTVYAVTCDGKFVRSSSQKREMDAYAESYNKFRLQGSPPAIVTSHRLDLAQCSTPVIAVPRGASNNEPGPFNIYAVWRDGIFVMASSSRKEMRAYVKTFNLLRDQESPAATIEVTQIGRTADTAIDPGGIGKPVVYPVAKAGFVVVDHGGILRYYAERAAICAAFLGGFGPKSAAVYDAESGWRLDIPG